MNEIEKHVAEAEERIKNIHISAFAGDGKPLFLISEAYPGIWLEHCYDAVFYAKLKPEFLPIAVNTINIFIKYQTEKGQLPCYIWRGEPCTIGYGQTQECVSFAKLALGVWKMTGGDDFLKKIYTACAKWENWLRTYRNTRGRNLCELFVGYDSGHDNSGRIADIAHPGAHYGKDFIYNAEILPEDDGITPIGAVDMSCNLYATEKALSEMATLSGDSEAAATYERRAKDVKEAIFKYLFDEEDCFFYDIDRDGKKRKIRSSTIFHLFLEGVLDKEEDAAVIKGIYDRYIKNPREFWSNYPFPAVSVTEKTREKQKCPNSWGYYSQALIALRCTMWMDKYGFSDDFDYLCEKWLEGQTRGYGKVPFGQELDPETGEPSGASPMYSSALIFYIYAAKRLKKI